MIAVKCGAKAGDRVVQIGGPNAHLGRRRRPASRAPFPRRHVAGNDLRLRVFSRSADHLDAVVGVAVGNIQHQHVGARLQRPGALDLPAARR